MKLPILGGDQRLPEMRRDLVKGNRIPFIPVKFGQQNVISGLDTGNCRRRIGFQRPDLGQIPDQVKHRAHDAAAYCCHKGKEKAEKNLFFSHRYQGIELLSEVFYFS